MPVLLAFVALSLPVQADDWPQWLGPQRDAIWREKGILSKFPPGGPKVLWRKPVAGGYAGPSVSAGRVYVTDYDKEKKVEHVYCLDEKTGNVVWTHEYPCQYRIQYPAGPRASPLVDGDRVYTLGGMGDLFCLQAADGQPIWSKNFVKDYKQKPPIWGFSAHPLLDGNKLICLVGGKGSAVVAFDKMTGKELWKGLDAEGDHGPGYAPPTMIEVDGKRQLVVWHPQAVNAVDPDTGKVYWSHEFPLQAGLSIPTPRQSGDKLFVTAFYNGPIMFKLDGTKPASVLWKGNGKNERDTDGLHAIMCTPTIKDGHIYGVCSYGQLRCLDANTGKRVWETFKATTKGDSLRWANAFLVQHEDKFFLFNEKGYLIIAKLTPKGYEEIDRVHVLKPTGNAGMGRQSPEIVWSHPSFANRCMFVRNDEEILCLSLAAE